MHIVHKFKLADKTGKTPNEDEKGTGNEMQGLNSMKSLPALHSHAA